MLREAFFSFLGGLWAGNGAPHLINGIARQDYPCKVGNGPTSNVLAGGLAMATSPLLFLAARGSGYSAVTWIFGTIGAFVSLVLHARGMDAGRLQTRGKRT